jgi:hypothetical protein
MLRGEWFPSISTTIERTQSLRQAPEANLPPAEPLIIDGFTMKQGAYMASEFAGRKRGFMGGVIAAARPLTHREIEIVGNNRGQIEAGWATVRSRPHLQSATSAAVAAFDRLGGSIRNIADVSGSIAAAVEEQRAATGEITNALGSVNTSMDEVSGNVGDMARGSVMSIAGAIEVLWVSQTLDSQATKLRSDASVFLSRVSS